MKPRHVKHVVSIFWSYFVFRTKFSFFLKICRSLFWNSHLSTNENYPHSQEIRNTQKFDKPYSKTPIYPRTRTLRNGIQVQSHESQQSQEARTQAHSAKDGGSGLEDSHRPTPFQRSRQGGSLPVSLPWQRTRFPRFSNRDTGERASIHKRQD